MLKLAKLYKKIFRGKGKGQTALEYALIIGGVAFVLFTVVKKLENPAEEGVKTLGDNIKNVLQTGTIK